MNEWMDNNDDDAVENKARQHNKENIHNEQCTHQLLLHVHNSYPSVWWLRSVLYDVCM